MHTDNRSEQYHERSITDGWKSHTSDAIPQGNILSLISVIQSLTFTMI